MAQLNKFLSFASSSLSLWSIIIIACSCNGTKSNKSCTFRSFRNVAFLSRGWAISTLVLIIEMGGGFVTIKPFTRQTQNSLQTYLLLSSIGTWARCRICGIPNISLVAFSAKTEIGSESAAALSEPFVVLSSWNVAVTLYLQNVVYLLLSSNLCIQFIHFGAFPEESITLPNNTGSPKNAGFARGG